MISRPKLLISYIFIFLLLVSCQNVEQSGGRSDVNGRIILWHSWPDEEVVVLKKMLEEFNEIHPGIKVVDIAIPENELLPGFVQNATMGAGPDLLIGYDSWIQELADSGLIRPYSLNRIITNDLAEEAVIYQEQAYALPFTLRPYALYYNKKLVDQVPKTLEELLKEAAAGNQVAFVPRFKEAYWGINAFGPDLFDENGRLDIVNSGLIPWLTWLAEVQNKPGVILNVDATSERDLFIKGEVAYYIAGPQEQKILEIEMQDPFGVATLPAGPLGPAGPLLPVESIFFYTYSSKNQADMALTLGQFLTNQQQSIRLMRELDKAPANSQISVDSRLYPTVSGFIQQARTAIVIPNEWSEDTLANAGDRLYAAVLSGEATPVDAACVYGQLVAENAELNESQIILPVGCDFPPADEE